MMDDDEEQTRIRARLEALLVEHRDLDQIIERLVEGPHVDELQIRRLKKRKLVLKDIIRRLESRLIPDIDA